MEKATRYTLTKGLVIGKFAPLHKGHQYVIERARKTCDLVYVLIYDSREVTDIPLYIRADWIRHLYPDVIVIEGWGGPTECGRTSRVMRLQEEYVKKVLPDTITHFFSSEWYGEHMSRSLGAENVVVDIERKKYPCSGTRIRENPHKYKHFLHPYVYKEYVQKIVFLGAESTGKSTLTTALAQEFHTPAVEEVGRVFWLEHKDANGKLTQKQLIQLAQEHIQVEDRLQEQAKKYLFVDTNAITTKLFCDFYHGKSSAELQKMARLSHARYDYWFVCETDIPYVDDGTRSGARHRIQFQKKILHDLQMRGIKYTLLSGSLQERMDKVKTILNAAS